MEVSYHRRKHSKPCVDGIPNYDDQIIQWVMAKVGCKPPYWAAISDLPPCSTFEEMKQFYPLMTLATNGKIGTAFDIGDPPCRKMERIQYDMTDKDLQDSDHPAVKIRVQYKDSTYKEIKSVRNMDFQALVGNVQAISIYQSLHNDNYWIMLVCLRCCSYTLLFSALGNAGGYLGLFLGYAILNVPEFLLTAFTWIAKQIGKINVQWIWLRMKRQGS